MNALLETSQPPRAISTPTFVDIQHHALKTTHRIFREVTKQSFKVANEKLELRTAYDLAERFVRETQFETSAYPFILLESYIAKHMSHSNVFWGKKTHDSLLEQFLESLAWHAVLSRDALISLYFHLYGMSPSDVIKLLAMEEEQEQRIYKNYSRWRRNGWKKMLRHEGISNRDIAQLDRECHDDSSNIAIQTETFLTDIFPYYRKSEIEHYPCLALDTWVEMYEEHYGLDYRVWHLAFCLPCMKMISRLRLQKADQSYGLPVRLHVQPKIHMEHARVSRRCNNLTTDMTHNAEPALTTNTVVA